MRRSAGATVVGVTLAFPACAPDDVGTPVHRQDPWPEPLAEDCEALPEPDVFDCAEQRFWDALRTDYDDREPAFEMMTRLTETLATSTDHERLSRLHFQRGQIVMAHALESGNQALMLHVVPAFERAMELDPANAIIPPWKDAMDIAFANIFGDDDELALVLERAWNNVERMPMGNVLSISGTTIGLALDTGAPQKTVELLDHWTCQDVAWCSDNTWFAPFARPGLAYHFGEAYARVGRLDEARAHFERALREPDADLWPYRHLAEEAAADIEGFAARFEAYESDESPFDIMYANSEYGCRFCHSPAPGQFD